MINFNKKLFLAIITAFAGIGNIALAEDNVQYPNISGRVLFELEGDRITSTDKKGVSSTDAHIAIDPFIDLNINKNWSVKTHFRLDSMTDEMRNKTYPERYRYFLSPNREVHIDDEGLIIEEIKGQFENEDLKFFFGKFNPSFGTAWRDEKRIGVFSTEFTRDYEMREKIGLGLSALLENSELTINGFFNDTTGLSNSGLERRGRAHRASGIAGDTGTLSSYSITLEGKNFLGLEDLFYNFGYRKLDVENIAGRKAEEGFVGGAEYLFPIGVDSSLIPFIEAAQINNLSGEQDRNVLYLTAALIFKYSGWNLSISHIVRDIKQNSGIGNVTDSQLQYSAGYKFKNNVSVDVTRMNLRENHNEAVIVGAMVSYFYEF